MRQAHRTEQNQSTRDFIRDQTGMNVSEAEAEEIRRSLVQYCQVLLEIHADITGETKDECDANTVKDQYR